MPRLATVFTTSTQGFLTAAAPRHEGRKSTPSTTPHSQKTHRIERRAFHPRSFESNATIPAAKPKQNPDLSWQAPNLRGIRAAEGETQREQAAEAKKSTLQRAKTMGMLLQDWVCKGTETMRQKGPVFLSFVYPIL